ncbi:MAG: Gfo/Idh/MocA family oxidoreductase [Actinomycetia bacterium]|nr:Gfo/Idh/MocA family oxidoreductase [Actinomycetes bacterium]
MRATDTDEVRWGFLGAGFVASQAIGPAVHASPHALLQSVAARDAERAENLEPRGQAVDDYQAILDDDSVEAVYISLTNEVHLHWITAALAAGKHVLCEKPLTLNADECRRAFSTARSAGLLLIEAAWTQWHPRTRRVDAIVTAGDLGEVRSISSSFTFDGVPVDNYRLDLRRGGGSLLDVGPYLLRPAITWVNGEWAVDGVSRTISQEGTDLRTSATLTATSGTTVDVLSSFIDPERQGLHVQGSSAAITFGSPAITSWREAASIEITDGTRRWAESFPACDAYELMISSASRRIRGDSDVYVATQAESVGCMMLIDLIDDACGSAA